MANLLGKFFVVQSQSHVQLFVTPWTTVYQGSWSFIICRSLPKSMSIELVMPSSHLILCHPLLLPRSFLVSQSFTVSQLFAPGGQGIGASASAICLFKEYSRLISFKTDWFELLRSLLQYNNLKASILQHSAFFMVSSDIHT